MEGPGKDIWREVADVFERRCGRNARELWLEGAQPTSFRRGLFTLAFDDLSAKAAVDARYVSDLEQIFMEITGSPVRLRTCSGTGPLVSEAELLDPPTTDPARNKKRGKFAPRRVDVVASALLEVPGQQMARRAIDAFVAGQDGFRFLLLHGPEGCGKTALARSALARLEEQKRVQRPLVLAAEELSQDIQLATRTKTFGELQRRWNGHDLLLLDEVHRLRGRRTTQDVARSLLAPCLERGGRVLLLSRHAPSEIHELSESLRSHLGGALCVALPAPDLEAREQILTKLAEQAVKPVEQPILSALAQRGPASLSQAATALLDASRRAAKEKRSLAVEDLRSSLRAASPAEQRLDALVQLLATETGVAAERIRSAEKSRDVASVRHLCVHLAHRSLGLSARQICRALGLRSPSVVAYARRAVERKRGVDPAFAALLRRLPESLVGAQRDLGW